MDPRPLTAEADRPAPAAPLEGTAAGGWRKIALRAEDWLLAGWIVVAAPVLSGIGGTAGPFESGHPITGLLQLAGFTGAFACLATRSSDGAPATSGARSRPAVLDSAAVGPLVGGLMLVGASAFAELGLDPLVSFYPTIVGALILSLVQSRLPRLPTATRRALVTPYLLVAGGLFWNVVHVVAGGLDFRAGIGSPAALWSGLAGPIGILILGAAVYYAMLIYAPRQVAEREGSPIEWLARFALFVVSVGLGLGWLSVFGG